MNRPVISSNVLGRDDEEAVAIRRVASCPSNLSRDIRREGLFRTSLYLKIGWIMVSSKRR